jgi:hypothetical protein
MKALLEKHIAGTLDEPLRNVRLRRKGSIDHEASGKLKREPNKPLSLEIKTWGWREGLLLDSEGGAIMRDGEYFSLIAQIGDGFRLNLQRLFSKDTPKGYAMTGIHTDFQPAEITIEGDATPNGAQLSSLVGYIRGFQDRGACCLSSRLGRETPLGPGAVKQSWFILQHAGTTFALGSERRGVRELGVWSERNAPEKLAHAAQIFLYALSLYVSERVEWLGYIERTIARTKCVLCQPVPERKAWLHQIRPDQISETDERDFLVRAFNYFDQSDSRRVVYLMAMLWDSCDNSFPIKSLVGTTVVEGIAKLIIRDRLPASKRIRSAAEKVGVTISKGFDDELERWVELRNARAHGDVRSNRPTFVEVEKDSTCLDCALNLTYKLVLGAIGYRGPAVDFSPPRWRVRDGEQYRADD